MLFGAIEPVETDRTSVAEEGEEKEQEEKAHYCPNISILALSSFLFGSHSLPPIFLFLYPSVGKDLQPAELGDLSQFLFDPQ